MCRWMSSLLTLLMIPLAAGPARAAIYDSALAAGLRSTG